MKSTLEAFAEKVVNTTLNINAKNDKNLGFDPTALLELIEQVATVIMEIMNNCPNKSTLTTSVKSPNFMQRIRFRSAIRNAVEGNLRAKIYASKLAETAMQEAAKLSDDEILKVVDESATLDNWIV